MNRTAGIRLLLALTGAACLSGCHSAYPAQRELYETALQNGGYSAAAEVAQQSANADGPSTILWSLELAAAQRAAGRTRACAETLESTETLFLEADAQPDIALGSEGLATFSNPYHIDYLGRNTDRVFAATYQALAHLELGEPEKARVCLTRSLFRQEDALRRNKLLQTVAEEEAAAIGRDDNQFQTRLGDSRLASARAAVNARFTGSIPAGNALATWLHGVFHLRTAEGPADLERARKSLQLAASMVSDRRYIAPDLELAEQGTQRPEPSEGHTIVYLLHEDGLAPEWQEQRVTIPLIYGDVRAPMVNLALPSLVPRARQARTTQVISPGMPTTTFTLLADVDALIYGEFKEAYPLARNRAIASATMKAVTGYIANRAAQETARRRGDDAGAHLLAMATLMATNTYALESAHADLRNWTSLPQEVRLARLEVAQGATLRITGGAIPSELACQLPKARAVVVTIRSISPSSPAILHTSILQP